MNFEEFCLSNKIQVYLVPLQSTQSVTVLVMYPVGSRYEPEKMSGVSHFIEHMVFKGTKKRPSALALTREIDRLGAEYNAFTGKECTGYYIKADAKYLEISLDILSDMLFNSLFEFQEMEKEKKVIVEEIRMYEDNPLMNLENVFENLLYQRQLGRNVAGSEKTVKGLKRENMLAHYERYYQPANMMIAVAGNIDKNISAKGGPTYGWKQILGRYFDRYKNKLRAGQTFKPAKFGAAEKSKRIFVQNKKTDQTQLMLGFPAFGHKDKRNPAIGVLQTILGGMMSSRLFIEIREKRGLAYMIQSGGENFRDTGYVSIRAGLEAKNINQALAVIKDELFKVADKGATPKELKDAKTHIRGALTLGLEDSSAVASWYAKQAMFMDKIKTPEERLREIDSVTNEQIKTIAEHIFDWSKVRIAVIGEIKKESIKY